jgi:hypothetical protein
MTFIPEEYVKLTDAQKTALYDVRKEARDKAPSGSFSAAAIAPAAAEAAAPAPAPVQRTIQAIGLVLTAPLPQIMGMSFIRFCPRLPLGLLTNICRYTQPPPLVTYLSMTVLFIRYQPILYNTRSIATLPPS